MNVDKPISNYGISALLLPHKGVATLKPVLLTKVVYLIADYRGLIGFIKDDGSTGHYGYVERERV